jgi:hypothetical protein
MEYMSINNEIASTQESFSAYFLQKAKPMPTYCAKSLRNHSITEKQKITIDRKATVLSPLVLAACGGGGSDSGGGGSARIDNGQPVYLVYSTTDTRQAPAGIYAGEPFPASGVSWQPSYVPAFDVTGDGNPDILVTTRVAYSTPIDSRGPTLLFENVEGRLQMTDASQMLYPNTTGSSGASIVRMNHINVDALVSANHLASPENDDFLQDYTKQQQIEKIGYFNVFAAVPFGDITSDVLGSARSGLAEVTGISNAINSHATATGDLDGDGLDDILIANYVDPLVLFQKPGSIKFEEGNDLFFDVFAQDVLDLEISDVNNDGANDIIVGFSGEQSKIYLNNGSGDFSIDNAIFLPESIFGAQNQLHLRTATFDYGDDGDTDVIAYYSRSDPHYSGNFLALYENDGDGNFSMNESLRLAQIDQEIFTEFLDWSGFIEFRDIDGDSLVDVVLRSISRGGVLTIFQQDGSGEFHRREFETDFADEILPFQWQVFALEDFDSDGKAEVAFLVESFRSEGDKDFYVQEIVM